jgi:hypothetical protein
MASPLGALLVGPIAATTEVEEGVDDGPLGALPMNLAATTTKVEEDIDDGSPDRDPKAPTINVKNVDGGSPRRCRSWRSRSGHHQC